MDAQRMDSPTDDSGKMRGAPTLIKRDVEDELRSDPRIDATDIAVAVQDDVSL
jgi:hypothetical protein